MYQKNYLYQESERGFWEEMQFCLVIETEVNMKSIQVTKGS